MKVSPRPALVLVPDSAPVAECQAITPPPNQFTHSVVARQSYYFGEQVSRLPDGELAGGTHVVLMVRGRGDLCRVVDSRGRYVLTSFRGLVAI